MCAKLLFGNLDSGPSRQERCYPIHAPTKGCWGTSPLQVRARELMKEPVTPIEMKMKGLATQSCPTLCDSVDHIPPGSSVLGFSRQEYWCG